MSVRLAVCGSNVTGEVPFSAALSTEAGTLVLNSPAGERGDLAQLCATLCKQRGLKPEQVTQVRVDVGPGSYTGLRVAVTFVRFLQAFGTVDVQAVGSLAALAMHACGDRDTARIRVLLDARRARYHTAFFELGAGTLVELEPAEAVGTEQVFDRIEPGCVVVMPSALAEQLADRVSDLSAQVVIAKEMTASALLADGLPWFSARAEDLEPKYLMASYAED